MSEAKIVAVVRGVGVLISAGQVFNLLIKDQDQFHADKDAVSAAGLRSSPWQQVDATPTRVDGQNQHSHSVCNPLHTTYQTAPTKDRLAVLDVLLHGRPRTSLLNDEALAYLSQVQVSNRTRQHLRHVPRDTVLDGLTMQRLVGQRLEQRPGDGQEPLVHGVGLMLKKAPEALDQIFPGRAVTGGMGGDGEQMGLPAAGQPADQGHQGNQMLFTMAGRPRLIEGHEAALYDMIAPRRVAHGCSSALATVASTERVAWPARHTE